MSGCVGPRRRALAVSGRPRRPVALTRRRQRAVRGTSERRLARLPASAEPQPWVRQGWEQNRFVTITVWMDGWQMECCGEPFAIQSTDRHEPELDGQQFVGYIVEVDETPSPSPS